MLATMSPAFRHDRTVSNARSTIVDKRAARAQAQPR